MLGMSQSDAPKKDPSMLGGTKYPRNELDFYPTPARAVEALLKVMGDDFEAYQAWEPCCGNGAISKIVSPHFRNFVSTDIKAYEGFDPDGLLDFNKSDLDDVAALPTNFTPDCIVTNFPYGKDLEKMTRHALKLLEPEKGLLIHLARHEWDTAKSRADLFDHPAFSAKITMRFRPKWIEGSTGAPRFSYAWFVWDWTKPAVGRPELFYVG